MTLVIRQTGLEQYLEGGGGRMKALILGAPGSGKTRSASFWPRPFFIDCEDGLMSVADRRVPFVQLHSSADLKELIAMLNKEAQRPPEARRMETLVFDTVDSMQRILMQEWMRDNKAESFSGWAAYGWLDAKMQNLLDAMFHLPFHVVFNCHIKSTTVGNDDDSYEIIVPKLKGDMRDQIAGEFDFVGSIKTYWEARNGERTLTRYIHWKPTPQQEYLKSRGGALQEPTEITFTPQDYLVIQGMIEAGLKALEDAGVGHTEEIERIVSAPTAAPVPPEGGTAGPIPGAVPAAPPAPAAKAAPKGAAKKAAANKPPAPSLPQAPPAAALPPAATPPPRGPVTEAPVTEEQAIENVETQLGGKVIEVDGVPTDAVTPSEAVVEEPAQEAPPIEQAATPEPATVPAQAADIPSDDGVFKVYCGQQRFPSVAVKEGVEGCGQELVVEFAGGRIAGIQSPEEEGYSAEMMEITGLRTRAFLDQECAQKANRLLKQAR